MVPFIVYKPSGAIVRAGVCSPEHVDVQANYVDNELSDDKEADPDLHYVTKTDGEVFVRDRQPMPIEIDQTEIDADGVDAAVISYLPPGAAVMVDDILQVTSGAVYAFTTEVAGTYVLRVEAFPYLAVTYTVTAT